MRVLNMGLRGIGGHSTKIIGLYKDTVIFLPSGDERRIHLFVNRGSVYKFIGRPTFQNDIRPKNCQQQREILSYKEGYGIRLFIPICIPESKGWNTGPPRGTEICNMTRNEELENEEPKKKLTLKKVKFDTENKISHNRNRMD
ncbi:hypothetical protein O181_065499 [Austropuccinia psidii MF-1]|uniref:Uncharacterized protein n=1 Tax=Austropuccinia psidii MF-1 TaxID=1389203 RepID=A0A9Q3ERK4_9BASI|nr:hypothetical protein [Austropuccinia psidii MF-1]